MYAFYEQKVGWRECGKGSLLLLAAGNHELQQALYVQRLSKQTTMKRSQVLAYVAKEIRNPLSRLFSLRRLWKELTRIMSRKACCVLVLLSASDKQITDDTDFDSIMEGYLDLEMVEFELHDVLITSISQVMMKSISKLQQVLVTLLLVSVNAILSGGQLGLATTLTKDSLGETVQLGHLELRITHSGGECSIIVEPDVW
ncbi:UNVERIFIED_CONTAM: Phytochrome A1 [Sesamum radiatum]|uniref:Phytochrome A1 n=1 Tax=Sesamum radiatum TaxID=300843 RepID=A0AAW2K5M0_SESRA